MRDPGVFSCAGGETIAILSQYRQSPQRVASRVESPNWGASFTKRLLKRPVTAVLAPPNPETLGSCRESLCVG
ncbi:hypothetical protein CA54_21620 [Symmachiella macrocystis]|uniref:Uncharacterized protein n=1 Tax=Symmachiella macrocystis TaxID=2527985 RepID=A0A5C6BNL1_9PLAN|nr:hypothetical protein CA54_21620 [Symmachiella macrocystis]